jgi:hypothetical protein
MEHSNGHGRTMARRGVGAAVCAILGVAAIAPAAQAAPNGAWKGNLYFFGSYKKADRTGSVKFKVRNHRVVAQFKYVDPNYNCINDAFDPSDDTRERAEWKFKSFRIKSGGKVHKVVKTQAARVELTGRFKGKVVKGKIDYTSYDAGCSKGWYWKATPKG